ncbi:hypothetical protein CONLIGDRAFT_649227 [Coniochaeta ligniaria NRRL 30616]|uniref:Nineteen complex-related protein 2-domain-containing protein n=1 Tax=Coniochaeta ligniaria NRRL 30616 TaxID=1408157 RepID=A0A1J7J8Q2_9PEZI|nr:hypothetical protein CONLIGDRAFT_649227 [Coniochaeta ligniaria NRRL 30616]
MSSLGARRKARIIQTLDDDVIGAEDNNRDANALLPEAPQLQAPVKFTRKPNKSSSLRKSINLGDVDREAEGGAPLSDAAADAEDSGMPVVIRPSISRTGSTKQKKKPTSSRLSFGPESMSADDDSALSTPAKPLSQRAAENALRKKPINLPSRLLGGDDDRPRYSKEYLSELQSSTPNTPRDLSTLTLDDDDESAQLAMVLDDPSELEGATVVPSETASTAVISRTPAATILSAAQVREKKERRARLALQGGEGEYIALDGSDASDDDRLTSKKSKDSRLIAEDEDLGEGYDEYVEDGGLSLGRAAEKKARMRRKKEMAELIASAEGPDGDEDDDGENSDDSLDQRAEYEAAQRRKGMGVEILDAGDGELGGVDMIPKMKPLPDFNECLQRMRGLVQGLEDEVRQKRMRIAALQKEREEIVKREEEVQDVLNQAGAKYQTVLGSRAGADGANMAAQSPLRNASMPLPPGMAMPGLAVERGLESFGTTPTARPEDEDMT